MNIAEQLRAAAAERILVKDGAYGTQVQARRLQEADYRGSLDARAATRRAITTS